MSEMVRADHFGLYVRPAATSTERVTALLLLEHGSCCLIRRRTQLPCSCLR